MEKFDSGAKPHEKNLQDLENLRLADTPDKVRELIRTNGYGVPMPEYDNGVMAWRDANLRRLEEYLRREGQIE